MKFNTRVSAGWRCGTAVTAIAVAAMTATPAFAQNPPADVTNAPSAQQPVPVSNANPARHSEIVVTGSLFRRTNTETPSPVTVLSQESLASGGLTNVNDAIRSVSADSAGSIGDRLPERLLGRRLGRLAARPRRFVDAGPGRRPALDQLPAQRRRPQRLCRSELDPVQPDRPRRSPEGRRFVDLWRRRDRRRGQPDPQEAVHRHRRQRRGRRRPRRATADHQRAQPDRRLRRL